MIALLLVSAALALLVFLAAVLSGEQHDDLVLKEIHHEYWGIGLQGVGAALYFLAPWPWLRFIGLLLWLAGNIIQWDDSLQHAVQRWTRAGHAHRSSMWYIWQAMSGR